MPNQAVESNAGQRKLVDVVSISRQFLRSVRIDTDLGREDALSGYVCQGTARALLENMAKQILETKQRAFTWTGPYGGGKSSLALTLCSLVGANAKLRNKARQLLGLSDSNLVHQAFSTRSDGWLVVPVVGKRADVRTELRAALDKARGLSSSRRKNTDVISDLVDEAEQHPSGVLVVIDELGKLLESTAMDGGDIGVFQELAECASRCSRKLIIVGILHQAFDAYANRLGREARDEWAKVQGRYIDIPLVAGVDEVIELVGRAITVSRPPDLGNAARIAKRIADAIRTRRPGTPETMGASLAACWPLHPVTAALLGPISRRKFGQNERSTFGFLASREPLGFTEYLSGYPAEWSSMYGPADYWDYLRANLEPSILASPDGHRWAQACEAVERAEAKGSAPHVALTKTIALIELFRTGSGLVADNRVLEVSVRGISEDNIPQLLRDLSEWRVLIERKHLGAWGIYAGSDFDIEGAIRIARAEIGEPDLDRVSTLGDMQPVLAKRLYHDSGTMRWFSRALCRLDGIERLAQEFKHKPGSAGTFLMCLPPIGTRTKSAEHRVRHASTTASPTLLFGTPKNAERIAELSLELAAAERVSRTHPELHGDPVARRELLGRIESVRSSLEEEFSEAFSTCIWYQCGASVNPKHEKPVAAIASEIAQAVYHKCPPIHSELLNRDEPSSNSVKARKDLMYRMVSHAAEPRLGYEGFPADAGLYFTILSEAGLHRKLPDGSWGFTAPYTTPKWSGFNSWWKATCAAVLSRDKSTSLADLYKFWSAPPYGLRRGVMPPLALAFFMAHRSQLALYVAGVFTSELDEEVVDEWVLEPARITFKHIEASRDQARLIDVLAASVGQRSKTEVAAAPLEVARGLVSIAVNLPEWAKRTTVVSKRAQEVRGMLLRASDPHKVLFADLPTLLDASSPDEINRRLVEVTDELTTAYGKMLDRVRAHLAYALDHEGRTLSELRQRASTVKGITGDLRLEAFVGCLERMDDQPASIETLISLAVSKPSSQWVDRDVDAAIAALASMAIDFRKAEAMAPLRNRPSTRRLLGVVFGASHGQDASGYVDIADKDQPAVERLVREFLADSVGERPEVVLAALAEAGALTLNKFSKGKQNG
jgi:hypothetical protein